MFIYSIGCSVTYGYGVNKQNSYPSLLKSYFNCDITNSSKCSVGNDWILHTALEDLLKLKSNPDLVILQWSGPSRRTHCDIDGSERLVTPYDWTELFPKFEPMASKHTLHYMFLLQNFLENNKINYFFFNYMDLDISVKNLSVYSEINWDKSLLINKEHMIKNKYSIDSIGHPNVKGHYYIANEILKKMGINESAYSNILNNLI